MRTWLLVLGVGVAGCSRESGAAGRSENVRSDAATPVSVASVASAGPAAPAFEVDDVRSVYPLDAGSPDPRVVRLCSALQDEPLRRRAECRHTTPGVVVTSECVRMLATAVRDGAVTLGEGDVDRCASAIDRVFAGCDWVGPNAPQPPGECQDLLRGTLLAGARCRSSLECLEGLHCDGLGPTHAGICRAPQAEGASCHESVDPLAVYARQNAYEAHHPECRGPCVRRRCAATGG